MTNSKIPPTAQGGVLQCEEGQRAKVTHHADGRITAKCFTPNGSEGSVEQAISIMTEVDGGVREIDHQITPEEREYLRNGKYRHPLSGDIVMFTPWIESDLPNPGEALPM